MNNTLRIFLILSALFLIILSIVGIKHKTVSSARAFSLLMIAMAIHSLGYGFELLSTSQDAMYFWTCFEYVGIAFYPVLILLFASEYTGEKRFANRFVLLFVFGLNLLTLIFVWTNQLHGLYYSHLSIDSSLGFPVFATVKGPWYILQPVTFYFAIGYALFTFFMQMIKTRGSSHNCVALMFTGMLIPLITSSLYLSGIGPRYIDLSPFTFLLLSLLVVSGLNRYDILFLSEITHEMVFNAIDEAVIVLDSEGYILNFNQASVQLFGALGELSKGDNIGRYPVLAHLLFKNMIQPVTIDERHYQVRLISILKQHGTIIVFTDVTEITNTKKQLEILATTDQLTGLYNRRYFMDYFDIVQNDGVIVLLDIDQFKKVNDQFGHPAGDTVLVELANCLKEHFPDGIICRLGGEEFVVLIEGETVKSIHPRADQFREAFKFRKTEIPCTLSIGLCHYEKGNYSNAIKSVDKLLYKAKNAGKNCVVAESACIADPAPTFSSRR